MLHYSESGNFKDNHEARCEKQYSDPSGGRDRRKEEYQEAGTQQTSSQEAAKHIHCAKRKDFSSNATASEFLFD